VTVTLRTSGQRPAPLSPAVPARPDAAARARPVRPFWRDLAATLALTSYSIAVAVGFARVFSGWGFLTELLVLAVVPHVLSFALRRARTPGLLAAPVVAVAALWLMLALRYGHTFSGPFPNRSTWRLVDSELDLVRAQFPSAVAPVIYNVGWAAMAAFAVTLVVVLADTFAFRAQARGEALVPGLVLFVFIAALGTDRLRATLTALLIATGVITVVALRLYHEAPRRVAQGASGRAWPLLVPAALATAGVVAGAAALVGPRLPGADAEALYDTRGRGGSVTEVLSPLVDIRSRLTSRGNTELFRVNADRAAYWRQTTLPEFDGSRFGLPSRDLERIEADEAFDPGNGEAIRQRVQVIGLGGQLVPAAADPFQASGEGVDGQSLDLRLNRDTSTLLTPDAIETGDLFTIVSAAPELTPDVLRAAGSANPPDPLFLGLPDSLPAAVGQLAAEVAGGAPTSYDAARALQDWFRTEFTYSLEVQAGHSNDAIETFLRIRVGYCEQFAGAFAAMARTLGIPTRVAVGYTPGVLGSDGWYTVRGRNAHAWPEVWFEGIGWVPFEPTPGRGAPGSESHTGLAAAQDTTVGGGDGEPIEVPASVVPRPTTPPTVAPLGSVPPSGGVDSPVIPDIEPSLRPNPGATPTDEGNRTSWIAVGAWAVLGLAVGTPWVVRRVRRAHYQGRVEQIIAAWQRAQAAAVRAGVPGSPAMTTRQWAIATATLLPVAARPMTSLAEAVDQVTFARPDSVDTDRAGMFGETLGDDCELWSEQVIRVADDLLSKRQKVVRWFTEWR
jgi:transglutaminase-like putative cysteine protease